MLLLLFQLFCVEGGAPIQPTPPPLTVPTPYPTGEPTYIPTTFFSCSNIINGVLYNLPYRTLAQSVCTTQFGALNNTVTFNNGLYLGIVGIGSLKSDDVVVNYGSLNGANIVIDNSFFGAVSGVGTLGHALSLGYYTGNMVINNASIGSNADISILYSSLGLDLSYGFAGPAGIGYIANSLNANNYYAPAVTNVVKIGNYLTMMIRDLPQSAFAGIGVINSQYTFFAPTLDIHSNRIINTVRIKNNAYINITADMASNAGIVGLGLYSYYNQITDNIYLDRITNHPTIGNNLTINSHFVDTWFAFAGISYTFSNTGINNKLFSNYFGTMMNNKVNIGDNCIIDLSDINNAIISVAGLGANSIFNDFSVLNGNYTSDSVNNIVTIGNSASILITGSVSLGGVLGITGIGLIGSYYTLNGGNYIGGINLNNVSVGNGLSVNIENSKNVVGGILGIGVSGSSSTYGGNIVQNNNINNVAVVGNNASFTIVNAGTDFGILLAGIVGIGGCNYEIVITNNYYTSDITNNIKIGDRVTVLIAYANGEPLDEIAIFGIGQFDASNEDTPTDINSSIASNTATVGDDANITSLGSGGIIGVGGIAFIDFGRVTTINDATIGNRFIFYADPTAFLIGVCGIGYNSHAATIVSSIGNDVSLTFNDASFSSVSGLAVNEANAVTNINSELGDSINIQIIVSSNEITVAGIASNNNGIITVNSKIGNDLTVTASGNIGSIGGVADCGGCNITLSSNIGNITNIDMSNIDNSAISIGGIAAADVSFGAITATIGNNNIFNIVGTNVGIIGVGGANNLISFNSVLSDGNSFTVNANGEFGSIGIGGVGNYGDVGILHSVIQNFDMTVTGSYIGIGGVGGSQGPTNIDVYLITNGDKLDFTVASDYVGIGGIGFSTTGTTTVNGLLANNGISMIAPSDGSGIGIGGIGYASNTTNINTYTTDNAITINDCIGCNIGIGGIGYSDIEITTTCTCIDSSIEIGEGLNNNIGMGGIGRSLPFYSVIACGTSRSTGIAITGQNNIIVVGANDGIALNNGPIVVTGINNKVLIGYGYDTIDANNQIGIDGINNTVQLSGTDNQIGIESNNIQIFGFNATGFVDFLVPPEINDITIILFGNYGTSFDFITGMLTFNITYPYFGNYILDPPGSIVLGNITFHSRSGTIGPASFVNPPYLYFEDCFYTTVTGCGIVIFLFDFPFAPTPLPTSGPAFIPPTPLVPTERPTLIPTMGQRTKHPHFKCTNKFDVLNTDPSMLYWYYENPLISSRLCKHRCFSNQLCSALIKCLPDETAQLHEHRRSGFSNDYVTCTNQYGYETKRYYLPADHHELSTSINQ